MATNPERTSSRLLQINVIDIQNNFPIQNTKVTTSYKGEPDQPVEQLTTNSSGQTEQVQPPAPSVEYSLEPSIIQPYSGYNLMAEAKGFEPLAIPGTEILAQVTAIQPVAMTPVGGETPPEDPVAIPDHILYGNYPPKVAESEIKPVNESGEIVLSRVVMPQTVVAHDGVPTDSMVRDYYVPYRDYIKNVASSEIYSTWPRAIITANVLAIMPPTLNRVYTEWYRNQGYGFTITSSTVFDHKWIYGRNVFENTSLTVDEIFDSYLPRPGVRQPILIQHCDGRQVQCPNWMTQWGSCSLGEQGYSPIETLRYFYGNSIYVNTAEQISGILASWPGSDLTIGSFGDRVRQTQKQLGEIATVYSVTPRVTPDGIYGTRTAEAVWEFQSIFGLPQTGVVDPTTWYKISYIYMGVTRIAGLVW